MQLQIRRNLWAPRFSLSFQICFHHGWFWWDPIYPISLEPVHTQLFSFSSLLLKCTEMCCTPGCLHSGCQITEHWGLCWSRDGSDDRVRLLYYGPLSTKNVQCAVSSDARGIRSWFCKLQLSFNELSQNFSLPLPLLCSWSHNPNVCLGWVLGFSDLLCLLSFLHKTNNQWDMRHL